ncbi:SHOCT domain-containing protein [Halomarina pelagica]|uniref:SHOCT domain-containing protein n=1 Tax=Halomarina pelagica TaxID=2961599 RepID=UPI0020C52E4D|nr:SHOCT domain-containing protein [Halomarina sp. BND7]
MSPLSERAREKIVEVLALAILGVGLLDLFLGVFPEIPFFVVWIVGYAVLLPIVALLLGVEDEDESFVDGIERAADDVAREIERVTGTGSRSRNGTDGDRRDRGESTGDVGDAIETLRARYARGDLTDEQFERKLDRLLETESPESAAEWRTRERERERERERLDERS